MEKKTRRFKLRNGIIVEESPGAGSNYLGGYIDDYAVVDSNRVSGFKKGDWICLEAVEDGLPIGGAHGPDYDIIEEITDAQPDTEPAPEPEKTVDQPWFARNPGGKRCFLFENAPTFRNKRWERNGGRFIEVPSTWRTDITFENSPRRIRSITPAR